MEDVRLPDLEVIRRFSIAVKKEHAPAAEVIAALRADLERISGGRRSATPEPIRSVAPRPAAARPAAARPAVPRPAAKAAPAKAAAAKAVTAKRKPATKAGRTKSR